MRALGACLLLAACSGGNPTYTVQVEPLVGGVPFACGQTYAGVGTTKSTIAPQDFRMYVHDVALVKPDGSTTPLSLAQDGVWQRGDVAFLDFEDGTGLCATDSPQTNFTITGTAPSAGYTGVQFVVGLPADEDHLSAATAPAPLDDPSMWWSWLGGYRYLRIDLSTTKNPNGYFFHLGASACTGASQTTIDCKYPNDATITLAGFDPKTSKVAFDLATLLSDANVDEQPDGTTTFTPGCMSGPGDPQCPPIYAKLGLPFEGGATPPAQTAFTVK